MDTCTDVDTVLHGWYSEKQKKLIEKEIWYFNMKGEIVVVTTVSHSMDHGCKFDDIVYMGILGKYHKTIK